MGLKLVIANKAYSSWSMRPWMLLVAFGVSFEEIVVPLGREETRADILRYSPTGKVPALIDGDTTVWDSLSIVEYVAESFPHLAIWPRAKKARALARSISAEMHSSFQGLRTQCPVNLRRAPKAIAFADDTRADIARIEAIWAEARAAHGEGGPFLFGAFSAADAMYAPVVNRLDVYDAPVNEESRAYMRAVKETDAWRRWQAGADAEPWRIEKYETI